MKIAYLEPHLKLVGGIRRIIETSNRMISRGHEVFIYTPTGKPCSWLKNNIPTLPISKINNEKFDVLIFNLAEQYTTALPVKANKKFFWVLAPEAEYKNPTMPLAALRTNKFRFLANSTYTSNYIKRFVKVDYPIPIISGGVNRDHFKYSPETVKTQHILYYGSPRPWKGTKIIEDAIHGLPIKSLKMEGLNTPQESLYKLYNSVNLCVVANQREGFSFIELEAMACGCPVICTDSGGNMDYVIPNKNAIVVQRSIQPIRQTLSNLLKDKNMRCTLRNEGLKTASDSKFNWDNITEKLLLALQE